MTPHNDNLKKLLRDTGRDNDPFRNVGTLNAKVRRDIPTKRAVTVQKEEK